MYFDERENILSYLNEDTTNYLKYEDKDFNKIENKETYKFKDNKVYDIDNININNFRHSVLTDLNSPKEGLNKGNMFNNIYDPYKNYVYKVIVRGEKDTVLLKIQELTFAMKDLNLYLDVHPNDITMFEQYKMIVNELNEATKNYERKYGPLTINSVDSNSYDWLKNPWPWDKGGNA